MLDKSTPIALSQFTKEELINSFSLLLDEKLNAFKQQELDDKLLSPAEACKLFQPAISKPTLASWDRQGLIKSYRIGNKVFYKYSELLESLKVLKRYKTKNSLHHDF